MHLRLQQGPELWSTQEIAPAMAHDWQSHSAASMIGYSLHELTEAVLSRLALVCYSLLIYLLRPLLLLLFVWRSRADTAYRQRFSERFALQSIQAQLQGGLLVHAVSMGEVVAAIPLIEALLRDYPAVPLTVTCTTPTGSARIRQHFAAQIQSGRVYHCYLPFDTPGANQRLLRKLAPQLILLLETELWPNLLRMARRHQVPVLLVNARLSQRSARGYRRFAWLVKPMLQQLTAILAQDDATAARFNVLAGCHRAAAPLACRAGNLKYDMRIAPDLAARAVAFRTDWGLRPVLVAGSTHAGEDEIILSAFAQVRQQQPDVLLILVPRHPDRFDSVARLIEAQGLSYVRRSRGSAVTAETAVLLGDSMGELMLWYQAADLVFIGGSLIPRGGHNPLEAMCLAKPVLSGPHVFNFAQAYQQLTRQAAVVWATDAASLAMQISGLLADPVQRQRLAEAGLQLYQQQGGATERILAQIAQLAIATPVALPGELRWCAPTLAAELQTAAIFQADYWQARQAVTGHSVGRNTVYFVRAAEAETDWVLRHYYRGGLIAKLNRDWFAPVPLATSRALAEFRLLLWMRGAGLPVPAPVAARYQQRGFGYSADILLERIPQSQDLFHLLQQQALSSTQWQQLGGLVARLHQAGVYHSDLNCHNILLDAAGQFWLIDFDKCARRTGSDWWPEPVARLQRSLYKEQGLQTSFHFTNEDWSAFMAGYQPHV
jgi:3-deoxy-D-manno-octulosonic-acid transferase